MQQARKCFHLECDKGDADYVRLLIDQAKMKGLFEAAWGRQVLISEVLVFESPKGDLKRMGKVSRDHINYHASMTYNQVMGILNLDEDVPYFHPDDSVNPAGTMTLRTVMYSYLKMQDGFSLVAEIHQRGVMGAVEVVVPNTREAENMVNHMNKQIAVFLYHYLTNVSKLPVSFVQELLNKSVDPGLIHSIDKCKWDEKTWAVTTEKDLEDEKKGKRYDEATWYEDAVSKYDGTGSRGKKNGGGDYAKPEAMYSLDDEKSVKTINQKNDGRYAGSKGAPVIDLNNKFGDKEKETIEIDDAEDDDDMSAISQLSQSELVARFKKLQKEMKKGSAPKDQDNKSHTGNGDNNDEDSDSSSSGSSVNSGMSGVSVSSDSSVESVTPPNAAPSG